MNDYFQRLFDHVFWADTRVLALLAEEPAARIAPVMRLFAHVLASERVWLLRLQGEDSSVQQPFPELSLEQLQALAAGNAEGYAHYFDRLEEPDLSADVVYATSQGVPYRNAVADILTHVALHGSYHRGQIAAALRAGDITPANTDYIRYARELTTLADDA